MTERPVTGGRPPLDGEAPWAMQLVLRVEKPAPPSRAAACAAAATAVVRLLTDPRSEPGGDWYVEVARWTDGPIRKHARRARGIAWQRVQALCGVTVDTGAAQARALVPGPLDALPREVATLQLTGSELPQTGPASVGAVRPGTVVVAISPQPPLTLGKAAAAAGHAAQLALGAMPPARRAAWAATGYAVAVEHPPPQVWALLRQDQGTVPVVDAGFTEVAPGSTTAIAIIDRSRSSTGSGGER